MRRATRIPAVLLLAAGLCFAVIIDRILVTVGNQVITESELELGVRMTAFMNQEPIDFSIENRRHAVERLIEQKLVMKELEFSKFPAPTIDEVAPRLDNVVKRLFEDNQAAYRAALEKYGITEEQLRRYLHWQMTFFRFVDFRFRPGIQVSEADIEDYFKTKVLPLAQRANPGKTISIDDYRDRIERILAAQREDTELQAWLKDTRGRTKIEYRDETLRTEPQKAAEGK
jgi:peptidyl-prolyl cis-trans isomerase SurA